MKATPRNANGPAGNGTRRENQLSGRFGTTLPIPSDIVSTRARLARPLGRYLLAVAGNTAVIYAVMRLAGVEL